MEGGVDVRPIFLYRESFEKLPLSHKNAMAARSTSGCTAITVLSGADSTVNQCLRIEVVDGTGFFGSDREFEHLIEITVV